MTGFFTPKRTIIIGLLVALVITLYFWRSEIYIAAENACMAAIGQQTIEANEQSRKEADAVKMDEQSRSKRDVIDGLRELGILRENSNDSE